MYMTPSRMTVSSHYYSGRRYSVPDTMPTR
jgi:hypothetical protein